MYAVNDETKDAIENATGKKCKKLCDIAIKPDMKNLDIEHKEKEQVDIIYLGRIIELKGIMLLMDVIKNIKTDKKYQIHL